MVWLWLGWQHNSSRASSERCAYYVNAKYVYHGFSFDGPTVGGGVHVHVVLCPTPSAGNSKTPTKSHARTSTHTTIDNAADDDDDDDELSSLLCACVDVVVYNNLLALVVPDAGFPSYTQRLVCTRYRIEITCQRHTHYTTQFSCLWAVSLSLSFWMWMGDVNGMGEGVVFVGSTTLNKMRGPFMTTQLSLVVVGLARFCDALLV